MKKGIIAMSAVLVVIVFFACTKKGPEDVAAKYYTHFYKGEFDKIQNYVLEEHRSFYGLMQEILSSAEGEREDVKVEVLNVECKVSDTVAICSCLLKVDAETQTDELKLKKVGEHWLVDQGKENGMSMGKGDHIPDGDEYPDIDEEE